jgi:hypothetical protein
MQNTLINLNIVSKIRPNDKIYVNTDNYISIEYDSMFQGFLRFIYNNSRNKNINNLNNFYSLTFNQIDDLLNSKYLNVFISKIDFRKSPNKHAHHTDEKSNFPIEHRCDLENENFLKVYSDLMEINHYIKLSISGLENLKKTYVSDVLTTSKIDIIINNVEFHIKKINKKLEHIDSIKRSILEEDYNSKKIK